MKIVAIGDRRDRIYPGDMGTTVNLDSLAERAAEFGFAYLITISEGGRIHTSVVHPDPGARGVAVAATSGRARKNAGAHPEVSLLWPPTDRDGYSLIVDGTARADGDALVVEPSRAVLHRPAREPGREPGDTGCTQDCIEL